MLRLITKQIIPLVLAVTFLNGCAFGTRDVLLSYPPPVDEEGLQAAQATTQAPKNGVEVIIGSVEDKRKITHRVGNVRNGLGMDTANVVATNNVRDWVVEALEWELKNAGYSVVRSASTGERTESAVMVSGAINTIYCDVYMTYDGDAAIVLKASQEGKEIINNLYTGSGSAGMNWAASEESYGISLSLALQDAITKFINELNMKLVK